MSQKKITALLMDWDNTLVDTWSLIEKAMHDVLVAFRKEPWTRFQIQANAERASRETFPKLFGSEHEKALRIYRERYEAYRNESFRALPGADSLLEYGLQIDLPMAIISNKSKHLLDYEIELLGWKKYFHVVIGSGGIFRDKPSAEPLLAALKILAIQETTSVWYVGDAVTDMESAIAANCCPVGIGERRDCLTKAKFTVNDCFELKKAIEINFE